MTNSTHPDFGILLRSYRKQHDLSQRQVAGQLQLSRNYVSQIERGESCNLSFAVACRILNLCDRPHGQIRVTLIRHVMIDAAIAPEIVWLNSQNVTTVGCCAGAPPTALILPSSAERARRIGYETRYRESVMLFEIELKSTVLARVGREETE